MRRSAKVSQDHLSASSRRRRALLGGMAAFWAGLAGSAGASAKAMALSAARLDFQPAAAPCGRSNVMASDASTVVATSAGKIRGCKRDGIYFQRSIVRRVDFGRKPLHAARQAGTLDRDSQRAGLWPRLSADGFRSLQYGWKEPCERRRRRILAPSRFSRDRTWRRLSACQCLDAGN